MTAYDLFQCIASGDVLPQAALIAAKNTAKQHTIRDEDLETEAWLHDRTKRMPKIRRELNANDDWYRPMLLLLIFHGEEAAMEWVSREVQPIGYKRVLVDLFPHHQFRYRDQPTPDPNSPAVFFDNGVTFTGMVTNDSTTMTVADVDRLGRLCLDRPPVTEFGQDMYFQPSYCWMQDPIVVHWSNS